MPYLILSDRKGEFDRRELSGPAVVGRALESDICVRDILLSRKHCRIEPFDTRWVVSDLGSRNGTLIGNETITRHVLSDGEVIKMGKTQICFRTGAFVAPPNGHSRKRDVRPSDPKEALSGTVLGFQLFDMEEDSRISGFPIPRPKPAEPAAYRQEEVHSLVAQMTSTSWDIALSEAELQEPPPSVKPPQEIVERKRQLLLEKTATPAAGVVEYAPRRAAVIRSQSPDRRATIPTWLLVIYLILVVGTAIAALAIIFMPAIESFKLLVQ